MQVTRDGRTFFYSDCGHLVACDDPTFDLAAEQARIRAAAFYKDLDMAVETGQYILPSSCPLSTHVQDALGVVAGDPSEENALAAVQAFERVEAWEAARR